MSDPIFDLTETTFVEGCWYVAGPGLDYMAMVFRDDPTGPWKATYRWRFYDTDGPGWNDLKRSYRLDTKKTDDDARDRLVAAFDAVAETAADVIGADLVVSHRVHGNTETFFQWLQGQPWAHLRMTPKAPARPQ
jgi:hypothetical protein